MVEYHHHTSHSCCSHQYSEEFPTFLVLRSRAYPISNLEVSDECSCNRKRRADHSAYDHCRNHSGSTLESAGHEYDTGEYECHNGHSAHRVGTDYGYGICGYSCEEEGYDCNYEQAYDCEPDVVHYAECEEEQDCSKCHDDADNHDFHRNVPLCPDDFGFCIGFLATEFFCGKSEGRFDYAEGFDDADDAGCGYASDAYVAGVVAENLVRGHFADCLGDACAHKVEHAAAPDEVHQRNDDEPYEEGPAADYE